MVLSDGFYRYCHICYSHPIHIIILVPVRNWIILINRLSKSVLIENLSHSSFFSIHNIIEPIQFSQNCTICTQCIFQLFYAKVFIIIFLFVKVFKTQSIMKPCELQFRLRVSRRKTALIIFGQCKKLCIFNKLRCLISILDVELKEIFIVFFFPSITVFSI